MKKSKFLFIGLLSFGLAFASCSSDDDTPPPAGTCATPTDVIVDNKTYDAITLSWVSTGNAWTIEYGVSGFSLGSGAQLEANANPFTITGLDASTDYDFYIRNNCSGAKSSFSSVASVSTPSPLSGTWEAYDVSATLAGAGFSSITAIFGSSSYQVTASQTDGTPYEFTGSYIVSEPNTAGIYAITLQQSTPSTATSEGILQVFVASPDSMWYEVIQTDPGLGVTAPTQEGGFGSSAGGLYGNVFVQKYHRQ